MTLAKQRAAVIEAYSVSRETTSRLDLLALELERWQKVKNLVGPSALPQIWHRHIADSLQLHQFGDKSGAWLDIGSGGGFPALIIAMLRTEKALGRVHMIESNGRKCAFLRHIVAVCGLDATIHEARIENRILTLDEPFKFISARAVASLDQLIAWTNPLLRNGALGIFPKGQDVDRELDEASTSWVYEADIRLSSTDPSGRIVLVRMIPT